MIKLGFFKIIGLIGVLVDQLSDAALDGKITITEALEIVRVLCKELGIDFDEDGLGLPGK